MELVKNLFVRIAREEEGQDMVEYALILGLISIIAVAAVTATGTSIRRSGQGQAAVAGRRVSPRSEARGAARERGGAPPR